MKLKYKIVLVSFFSSTLMNSPHAFAENRLGESLYSSPNESSTEGESVVAGLNAQGKSGELLAANLVPKIKAPIVVRANSPKVILAQLPNAPMALRSGSYVNQSHSSFRTAAASSSLGSNLSRSTLMPIRAQPNAAIPAQPPAKKSNGLSTAALIAGGAGAALLGVALIAGGGCGVPPVSGDMLVNPLQGAGPSIKVTSRDQLMNELANHPTAAQLECRKNAPTSPKHVVFGFSGLLSYGISKPLIKGMLGNTPEKDVDFRYYPWDSADSDSLTDVARCAYELATKPYQTASGQTVYNSLVIMGHSFGGGAANKLSVMLGKMDVAVDLAVFADPRESGNALGGNAPNWGKSNNVVRCESFYQKSAGLPGYPVNGCKNRLTSGCHIMEPTEAELKASTESNLKKISLCKTGYTKMAESISANECSTGVPATRLPATVGESRSDKRVSN